MVPRPRITPSFVMGAPVRVPRSRNTSSATLVFHGRVIRSRRLADGVAWFDFANLCEGPRSAADYIEIARGYPTVILSGVSFP